MLNVQNYLNEYGITKLQEQLAIKVVKHPELPLIILNYNQLESPKLDPIVMECRGLVLHSENFKLISKGFNRFFNFGECPDLEANFDFSNFTAQEKVDGSFINIFYFDSKWHANTRGSFGMSNLEGTNFTWQDLVCKALNINNLQQLSEIGCVPGYTYICELCSLYNKVVQTYKEPTLFFLASFHGEKEVELPDFFIFKKPTYYKFDNIQQIKDYIVDRSLNDVTYEGLVIKDGNNLRFKIKSQKYLALHHMKGESGNLFHPKHLLPFILSGETGELLAIYPECTETLLKYRRMIDKWSIEIDILWGKYSDVVDQKTFALGVKDHPLSVILFDSRKKKVLPKIKDYFNVILSKLENYDK